jgi:hypothetical protein
LSGEVNPFSGANIEIQIMLFPPPFVCAIAHPGKYEPFPLCHSDLCPFERNCWSMDEMIGTGCKPLIAECEKAVPGSMPDFTPLTLFTYLT